MTIVKVMEKLLDKQGNPLWEIKQDKFGQNYKTSQYMSYYMDLTNEEERKLIEMTGFAFEGVPNNQKITDEVLKEGEKRKKALFKSNYRQPQTTKLPESSNASR